MVLAFIIGAITLSLGVSANSISTSSFISNSARRDYMDKMINEYLETQPDFMNVLKQGKSVIMFFEGGSDNEDNATYSNNPNYYHVSAVCIVLKWNESEQKVYIAYASENCTTIPDHPLAYGSYSHGYGSQYGTATLKDGIYNVYTVNHKGEYSGLNVRLSNGSSSVPAVYMKSDGTFSEMNASGINIHTRTTSYVSSSSNPWSAGCILVGGAAPLTEYNSFINTVTPTNITKSATTYKGYSTYYYNTTGSNVGLLVINRFLYRDKMMQIYKNNDAINEITKFSNIIGNVDACVGNTGSIVLKGWAFDDANPTQSLEIHAYVGGMPGNSNSDLYVISANKTRIDINDAYQTGTEHGFDDVIAVSKSGKQEIYVYARNPVTDQSTALGSFDVNIPEDTSVPLISDVYITNVTDTNYTVSCNVSDNIGISKVEFPTWTINDGQDDLAWHVGEVLNNNAVCTIDISNHNNETGIYATDIYVYDIAGNYAKASAPFVSFEDNTAPTISNLKIKSVDSTGYVVQCTVNDDVAVNKIEFPAWTINNDLDDLIWHKGEIIGNTATCVINTSEHNNEKGMYATDVYVYDTSGNVTKESFDMVIPAEYYIVSFDTCDSNIAFETKEVRFGEEYGVMPAPTRDNYTFIGWFTENNGGEQILSSNIVSTAFNHTLYAHWEKNDDIIGSNAKVVIDSLEVLDETYELIDNIPDATFFAEVTITNQLSANKIYILIATYDTDGRMLDIDFLYANPQIGQTVTFGTQIKNSDGKVAKVKAFVISDLKSFSALAEAKEITKA